MFRVHYRNEALDFLKERLGDKRLEELMMHPKAREHPYVVAKLALNPMDWEKYVYIEQNGNLVGFEI